MPTLAVTNPDSSGNPQAIAIPAGEVDIIKWTRVATKEKRDKLVDIYNTGAADLNAKVYRASLGLRQPGPDDSALDARKIQVGATQLVTVAAGKAGVTLPEDLEWMKVSALRVTVDTTGYAILSGARSDVTH